MINLDHLDDLEVGKAGEYLVCADLILKGYMAFPSDQGLPFDVVSEVKGKLIKIQVRTVRKAKIPHKPHGQTPVYLFHIKRTGKGGKKEFTSGSVDLFAFVALDTKEIGYLPFADVKRTMLFRSSSYRGSYGNEFSKRRHDEILGLRDKGLSYNEIAKELNIKKSLIASYFQRKRFPNGFRGKGKPGVYVADLDFERAVERLTEK